jgi:hypothetical protein
VALQATFFMAAWLQQKISNENKNGLTGLYNSTRIWFLGVFNARQV